MLPNSCFEEMKSSKRNTSPDLSHADNVFRQPNALPDRNHCDNGFHKPEIIMASSYEDPLLPNALPDRNHYDNGFHTPEILMASSYEEPPPLHEARQGLDSQSSPRSLLAAQGDIPPHLVLAKPQIDKQENTCCFKLWPRLKKPRREQLPRAFSYGASSTQDHGRIIPFPHPFRDKNSVAGMPPTVSFQPHVLYHQTQDGEKAHLRPTPKRTRSSNGDTLARTSAFVKSTVSVWSPGLFSAFETIPDQKRPKP